MSSHGESHSHRSRVSHAVRLALLTAGAFGTVVYAAGAAAQDQADQPDAEVTTVTVTGTRLQRANITAPTAVTTIDSEDLQRAGLNNVADVLRTVPSFGVSALTSANSNFLTSSSGINTLQLRNLEEDRTLVLVNGRRHVAGVPGSAAVDFNTIPVALIERVEIITGGASAIYGSDALAGVINVILKDKFEGVELGYQFGEADDGGNIENRVSFTAGGNFAEDRGNAVVSATFSENRGLFARERPNTQLDDLALCIQTDDPADCQTEIVPVFSSFAEGGRFFVPSTGQSFAIASGTGSTATVAPWNTAQFGFNRQAFRRYTVPTDRYLLATLLDYEVADNTKAFFEATFAQTRTESELEPFPHSNSDLNIGGIPVDNPFVPQAIRDAVVAAGDDVIEYFRRTTELGARGATSKRDTFRFVVGFEGEVAERFNWTTYYLLGRMDDAQQGGGQLNALNFREALNVVDGDGDPLTFDPVCANPAAVAEGCVPVNLFGQGSISPEAADYLRAPSSRQILTQQEVAGADFRGSAFELPAGPIEFAVGAEWRRERAEDVPDVLTQRGLNAGNAEAPVIGDYDVKEGFAEFEVPLLKELPLVNSLSIGGAYRYSEYSTVGSTDAYAGRVSWAPIESLRFRGQYARAVRAPNISELFSPGGENFANVSDPCNGVTATSNAPDGGPSHANCRAIPEIAARIAATGTFTLTQTELQGTGGFTGQGNLNLDAETSDSWALGAVFDHRFTSAGQMTVSLDYFNIKIEQLIDTIERQTAADFCFDAATFPNQFCSFLTRDTTGPAFQLGELEEVNSGFVNEGVLETTGVDLSLFWGVNLQDWFESAPGRASLRVNWTHLLDFEETKFGALDNLVGDTGYAKNKGQTAILYAVGGFDAQWEWNYISDSVPDQSNPTFNFSVGAYNLHDLQLGYTFGENFLGGNMEGTRLYFGVNNVLDEDAPIILSGVPGNTTGTDTDASVYDPIGRTWYAGLNLTF
jgi:outer membrane receptor protein involved in Fe transport